MQVILLFIVLVTMWLPFYKKLKFWHRLLIVLFVIVPTSIYTGILGGIICIVSYFIRMLTLVYINRTYVYTCEKCDFKKEINQKIKIYKCPQCGMENIIE
jgi:DNA-directed RNA polymerase subunit RPC12/RpoP